MNAQQEEELLRQYENELALQQSANASANNVPYSSTMFGGGQKQNLVEWQLDFKQELEDIERLLRCDVLVRDKEGNEIWTRNPDKDRIVFNDIGVNDILRQIRMFLNKNKVLSNYDMEEIKPRIKSISHELRMLVYNNYEAYGMDNDYKQNNYPIIILTISAMIEDSYRRALYGEERRDLNQARVVNQNEPMYGGMQMPMQSMSGQGGRKSILKPWTWFGN